MSRQREAALKPAPVSRHLRRVAGPLALGSQSVSAISWETGRQPTGQMRGVETPEQRHGWRKNVRSVETDKGEGEGGKSVGKRKLWGEGLTTHAPREESTAATNRPRIRFEKG